MFLRALVSYLIVLSFVTPSLSRAAGADGNDSNIRVQKSGAVVVDPLSGLSSSRQLFSSLMKDPFYQKMFHAAQLMQLQTVGDKLYYDLFTLDPIFSSFYELVRENQDAILEGFVKSSQTNRTRIVRGITPQYDLLDAMVVKVAVDLGFPEESIRNREIYIQAGDTNAFTVSGSQKKIVVVFQQGILEGITTSLANQETQGAIKSASESLANSLVKMIETIHDGDSEAKNKKIEEANARAKEDADRDFEAQKKKIEEANLPPEQKEIFLMLLSENHKLQTQNVAVAKETQNPQKLKAVTRKVQKEYQESLLRLMKKSENGMTLSEIYGVLAHELGHIRAEHIVKGVLNNIFISLIGQVSTGTDLSQEGIAKRKVSIDSLAAGVREMSLSLQQQVDLASPISCYGCSHNNAVQTNLNISAGEVDLMINQLLTQFASLPAQTQLLTFSRYLDVTIKNLKMQNASPQSIAYFSILKKNLGYSNVFRTDATAFKAHATQALLAASRSQEQTADMFSASVIRNSKIASAFAKLLGLNFDKEYRGQIFNQIVAQAKEFIANYDSNTDFQYVGSTHPALVLRIHQILSINSYPTIAFANPFTRIVMVSQMNYFDYVVKKQALIRLTQFVQQNKATIGQEQALEIRQSFNQLQNELVVSKTKIESLENSIIDLMVKGGDLSRAKSPRIENLIQYLSTEKQISLVAFETVNLDPNIQKIQSAHAQDMLKSSDGLVDKLLAEFAKIENATTDPIVKSQVRIRVLLLSKLKDATTAEQLEDLRKLVTRPPRARSEEKFFASRIPIKNQSVLSCTSLFR